jgi:hypothetical protein
MEDFQEVKSRGDPNPTNNKRGQKSRGGSKEGRGQHYQKKQQDEPDVKESPTSQPATQQQVKV